MNTDNEYNARVISVIANQLGGSPPPYARYVLDTMGNLPDFASDIDTVHKATVAYIRSKPECYEYPTTVRTEVARLQSAAKYTAKLPTPLQHRSVIRTCAHHVEYVIKLHCDFARSHRELWRGYRGPNMPESTPPTSPTVHENKLQ